SSSAHLEEKIAVLNARIENQDVQFQRLKAANAQLRDSNALLRDRNSEMLGDPSAVNQSMIAELEALKATRAAEVDEMDTILDELKPLMEGQANG
ncbi:MAG: cell division protein FtsB, partial [Paracoccaceae bacterium]